MRTIKFGNLHRGLSIGELGTPVDLISEEFLLGPDDLIPPLHVVNPLFAGGRASEHFTWKPFQVDAEEWKEIVAAFGARGCRTLDPPEWVRTPVDWSAWRMEVRHGIPAMKYLRSIARDERLAEQIREALAAGDQDRVLRLHLERVGGKETLEELDMLAPALGGTRDPDGPWIHFEPDDKAEGSDGLADSPQRPDDGPSSVF